MRLDVAAGHSGLDVAMRLAGRHIHIVLKLRARTVYQSCWNTLMTPQARQPAASCPITCPLTLELLRNLVHCRLSYIRTCCPGLAVGRETARLAGDWTAGQEVQVGHVEEDRVRLWYPARNSQGITPPGQACPEAKTDRPMVLLAGQPQSSSS